MQLRTLPKFKYFAPKTIREACSLLREHRDQVKVLAGGTDLLVNMKYGTIAPRMLVGLKSLPGLNAIAFSETEGLRLGPLVTLESIATHPIIKSRFRAVAYACSKICTPQIRNMGTIGGNVCNASPSADSLPPLIAYGAAVKLISLEGERILPLESFFTGPGKSVCQTGEILSEIHVLCPAPHTGAAYVKLPARTAEDIATVSVAVAIILDPLSLCCREAKIVLGAVAPTPVRARKAEDLLRDNKVDDRLMERAAHLASEAACPISDIRSSAGFRTEMVKVLTREAIGQALELAGRAPAAEVK